jgi:hypothetical protein
MSQGHDPYPQGLLVIRVNGQILLGGPALPAHATRPAFSDRQDRSGVEHCLAASGRAQKFPAATSFKMLWSSERSATSPFSRAFSCSNPFNRLA